jgi:hypothetical protein
MGVTLACTGFALVLSSVTAHWRDDARCRRCGYDLRAHAAGDWCPECGQSIAAFRDGFIERRPIRLIAGLALLVVALGAFASAFSAMLGY